MLDLVAGEPHQRFERKLVAEYVGAALIEHLGADESLDQPEDIGVGAALDLAEQPRLVLGEKAESIDPRKPVGQELAREVEGTALQQIAIDLPFRLLRRC